MPLLPLLLASALTISDPAGDAHGDGGYVLPTRPAVSADALDLRAFTAAQTGQSMRFTVDFGQIGNPWDAPSGFSAGVTDIFVKAEFGGQQGLADTGLRTRGGAGWRYHLRITGFGSTLTQVDDQGESAQTLTAPTVRVEGSSLVVDAAVPAGRYAYWVTSSVYTPLSASGVLRPTVEAAPTALQAGRRGAPTPVDVLAEAGDTRAFSDDTLAPVGQTRDRASVVLAVLGAVGLLLTVGATVAVWRHLGRR